MASGRMTRLIARLAALLLALSSSAAAAGDWRPLADDRLLVIDTSRGRMVILLQPEFAPRAPKGETPCAASPANSTRPWRKRSMRWQAKV